MHIERGAAPHQRLLCGGAVPLLHGNQLPYVVHRRIANRPQGLAKPWLKPPNGCLNRFDGILSRVFAVLVLVQIIAQHIAQRGRHDHPLLGSQLLDVLPALHGKTGIACDEAGIRQCVPRVDVQAGIVTQYDLGHSWADTGLQHEGLAPRPHVHAKAWGRIRACVIDNVLLRDSHLLNAHHPAVFDNRTDGRREFGQVVLGEGEAHAPLGQLLWQYGFIYILATKAPGS